MAFGDNANAKQKHVHVIINPYRTGAMEYSVVTKADVPITTTQLTINNTSCAIYAAASN